ncbi:MAG: Rer1 family isoform 2 [Trebouxia sp. A1-2]|nr:MAG: Rer1 family isoform 2 [Trebouxia sp. A1-2]
MQTSLGGQEQPPNPLTDNNTFRKLTRTYRYWVDKSVPHIWSRWLALLGLIVLYGIRVYFVQGFYIVTYAMGIYSLNLLLGFLTPQIDPDMEGPTLPSKGNEEFRPFVRRLPEFKFWYNCMKAILIGTTMTLFPIFDIPVFWPILLLYWLVLLFITMRRQIRHMIKYRYIPFSTGKKRYKGSGSGAAKRPAK